MNANIESSAIVIEVCYETNRAIVRFEGVAPEIGAETVFLLPGAKPMARVNSEGFIVECDGLPLSPGTLLYATPDLSPNPVAQVVAVHPLGPDGHGVNWLKGKRPKPGDLLYASPVHSGDDTSHE